MNIIGDAHTKEIGKKRTPENYIIIYMNEYLTKKIEINTRDIYDYIYD